MGEQAVKGEMTVSFEQATIKVQKQEEYSKLEGAIEQVFSAQNAERFLKRLDSKNVRIRDFDGVLAARAIEDVAEAGAGFSASQLYQALPLSDQAQMRELYLSKLEDISQELRHRFKKLYQYY